MSEIGPVVVGIDELSVGDVALRWAIDQARTTGTGLRLVGAFQWVFSYPWERVYDLRVPEREELRRVADRRVAEAHQQASALAPELAVESAAIEGGPVSVLLAESETASVLVLGSRQSTTFESVLLGSVAAAVCPRAHCPVVIPRAPAGELAERAAVVVGVDDTEAAEAVLAFAFDYASRHRLPLKAVLCWKPWSMASLWPPAHARPSEELPELWLSEALAGWREKYPDVEVRAAVHQDAAVPALVADSLGQSLLVVGTRGRHALAGTLLGSVSQGVLHHALCPVAVVPSPAG
jgi:nucleotide-binding universal stress UspA family protein